MYLQEIFDALSEGELSQTSLATIGQDRWPAVVNHINLGLGDLFKRFFLREGRLRLQLMAGRTSYALDAKHTAAKDAAATDSRYILNPSSAPFGNDLLKVERVIADSGTELVINDDAARWPVFVTDTYPPTLTVDAKIVAQDRELPDELKTSLLQVVYRARHPKIDVNGPGFDPSTYDVRMPDSHLQALLYYVASRVLGPAGLGQQEGISSGGYWKRYESECAQLAANSVQITRSSGYDKLRDRGFV